MTREKPTSIGIVVTGASGGLLALETLHLIQRLKEDNPALESHAIFTKGGKRTCALELSDVQRGALYSLPDKSYDDTNLAAPIASGSNTLDALLFVPCSIRSLSAIAYSQTDRLSIRAADVMLKERRRLVLAVRESPLHAGHLQSMLTVSQMGGIIAPPVPAFYLQPESVEDMAKQTAARLLMLLGLDLGEHMKRWEG
ncbi:4-hydroxy-3-polyprenylbenzoate decarboxylase [Cohaesibacter sp. ES.047]|uniref:UbiX family flavin prenyltransferase n=1 Tax=Cohaesibacter sp. ES.047 TaxID=1798205 RepID=UPI000BB7F3C1|nr:UbiX family flavin prenyltransferase [Cohaesibacter sp. ES.047]SNY93666.1 4-hydroxy-3-polyprenylbenzoate decarboxylase [Cohaesibacter sp. ES.047]